jgi:hypothetical protein
MQALKCLLTGMLFFTMIVKGFAATDSLHYEVLLTPAMAAKVDFGTKFINSLDITAGELVLLSTSDQFYILGWGGIERVGKKVMGEISSFAYTADSLLMTIRDNELCLFNKSGDLSKLYTLPANGMGISKGRSGMYIYDRDITKAKHSVYLIAHGGMYSKLFDVPATVNSIAEIGNTILFTNGNTIFSYDPVTKERKAIVSLPEDKIIKSVITDPKGEKIFFATDSMIFTVTNSEIQLITDKMGGTLLYFNGLIVFNPELKYLIRIAGLP